MVRLSSFLYGVLALSTNVDAFKVEKATLSVCSAPFSPVSAVDIVNLRGGGDIVPIDATLAAKVTTSLFLIQGLMDTFMMDKVIEGYGWTSSPLVKTLAHGIGANVLFVGVLGYSLIFSDAYSVEQALGLACLSTFIPNVKGDMSLKDAGLPDGLVLIPHILNTIGAFAGLTGADWATNYFKFFAGFCILNFALSIINPEKLLASWDIPTKDAKATFLAKSLFGWVGAVGLTVASLLRGSTAEEALAHALALMVVFFVSDMLIVKTIDTLGLPKGPAYFWNVVMAILSGAVLL